MRNFLILLLHGCSDNDSKRRGLILSEVHEHDEKYQVEPYYQFEPFVQGVIEDLLGPYWRREVGSVLKVEEYEASTDTVSRNFLNSEELQFLQVEKESRCYMLTPSRKSETVIRVHMPVIGPKSTSNRSIYTLHVFHCKKNEPGCRGEVPRISRGVIFVEGMLGFPFMRCVYYLLKANVMPGTVTRLHAYIVNCAECANENRRTFVIDKSIDANMMPP
jgi:hypothetical protein